MDGDDWEHTEHQDKIDEEDDKRSSSFISKSLEDTKGFTENYLLKNGIGVLVRCFNPDGDNLVMGKRFLNHYDSFLRESGLGIKLDQAVFEAYGRLLEDI